MMGKTGPLLTCCGSVLWEGPDDRSKLVGSSGAAGQPLALPAWWVFPRIGAVDRQQPHLVCERSTKLAPAPLVFVQILPLEAEGCGAHHFTALNLTSPVFERLTSCGVVQMKKCGVGRLGARQVLAWGPHPPR